MQDNDKKPISIDDLAIMVADGFSELKSEFKKDFSGLTHEVSALKSNVNNYLELSEKRYSELKQRDALLAKWLKLVADKSGVPIDVSQLEKI